VLISYVLDVESMIFYSESTAGFHEDGQSKKIPGDAVEITPNERLSLLEGQSAGKAIGVGEDGRPTLVDRPGPSPELILGRAQALLGRKVDEANAQVLSLSGRIDTLKFAITDSEDAATKEEIAELPVREQQLAAWRRYCVVLGRVPTLAGWPDTPTWPDLPE
jgi:hypothetical protein